MHNLLARIGLENGVPAPVPDARPMLKGHSSHPPAIIDVRR
jgi:hypothetical protein